MGGDQWIPQSISQSMVCHMLKGLFHPASSSYPKRSRNHSEIYKSPTDYEVFWHELLDPKNDKFNYRDYQISQGSFNRMVHDRFKGFFSLQSTDPLSKVLH